MPKGTYSNERLAKKNAKLIIKLTGCDAIKLESNAKNYSIIKSLVKMKIPVMGHIGYTPQFKKKFKIEGNSALKLKKLLKEAVQIEKAGVSIELIPSRLRGQTLPVDLKVKSKIVVEANKRITARHVRELEQAKITSEDIGLRFCGMVEDEPLP